jgi:hypothetical protein
MGSMREVVTRLTDAVLHPDGSYRTSDGDVYWFNRAGDLHSEEGPTCLATDGPTWWLNGIHYSFEDWIKLATIPDEDKMMLRLQYE